MRPLIEQGLLSWQGTSNATVSSKLLVDNLLLDRNRRLKPHVKDWIIQLEGPNADQKAISRNLTDVYSLLSQWFHHPTLQDRVGLVCGGEFPVRTVTALFLLALQNPDAPKPMTRAFISLPIEYTDEHYKKKCMLRGGKVVT
jgi:hypothetical protein